MSATTERRSAVAEVEFGDLTPKNVGQLRLLNEHVFPVKYADKFYNDLVANPENTRLAYHCDVLVGAVSWRLEALTAAAPTSNEAAASLPPHPPAAAAGPAAHSAISHGQQHQQQGQQHQQQQSQRRQRLYIMTLGVLGAYRGLGIGTKLLQCVLGHVRSEKVAVSSVEELYLHVQTNNDDALRFYKKFGFDIVDTIENYYKKIEPPNCHVLRKRLLDS